SNGVSRIVTGPGMAHTVKGKTDSLYVSGVPLTSVTISTSAPLSGGGDLSANRTISVDTSQSVAGHALVTHHELNALDTVGTLSSGVWNATPIDTAYTSGVSRIVVGTGLSLISKGKTDSLFATGGNGTVTSVATSFPLTGGTITGSGTISVDTSDAAAALATNDKIRNTDSVGT